MNLLSADGLFRQRFLKFKHVGSLTLFLKLPLWKEVPRSVLAAHRLPLSCLLDEVASILSVVIFNLA